MYTSTSQACSALVHKFQSNICSFLNSSETELSTDSHIRCSNKMKNEKRREEAQNNEMIVSSDISTSSKEQIETTMGNKVLKEKSKKANFTELTDNQIEMLISSTNFSAEQIREWHESFIRDYPSGKLDRKQFIEVYQKFYPQGKASNFCSLAFKTFDRDNNGLTNFISKIMIEKLFLLGIIDFNEFLTAIVLTMSSELKDRLDLAFSIYDINGDGLLDKKELTHIIKLIYEVNGKRKLKQDLEPQDIARMIIDKFDIDGDRKLSRQEFIDGCLNDSQLRKLLTP
ncbi:unnamed protein product [Rotaria sp. Silwood2]|nr:unnamed protein product [Rotaria sp. Silwood2]CAF2845487.1 unnamed protein product [Rotaria sp. Silwood2]CAF3017326.1 unnamed protein product [Rotaria sp. Silwood2]CAF4206515.1 unnamed protein product [Rotaria sp. Silwood2]CAF4278021.1 unnamed protein product [Rotaria sp. Silwood2]